MGEAQLGQKLSDGEIARIRDFLMSLTGKRPEVALPVLPPSAYFGAISKAELLTLSGKDAT